jgi:RNA polymerase sigma-70 factor (ECF subfamily)
VHEDPDQPLVIRAAAGDREAFGHLVERYQSRIYNLVMALGVRRADAEDVAQEVFVRAFQGITRFRGDSRFRTWLYQVAVNAVRSYHAAPYQRETTSPAWHDDPDVARDEPATEDPFVRRLADRELIDRALAGLPAEWREAVTLRDIEGFSYREIADLTGMPLGTVESRIFRARQQLRTALSALLDGQSRR